MDCRHQGRKTPVNTQRRILLGSVALNLALIVFAAHRFFTPSVESRAPQVSAPKTSAPKVSTGELSAELTRLRGLGLSLEETMPIILDRVRRSIAGAAPAVSDKYWQSDWQSVSREVLVARSRQTEAIRAELLSVYGAEAESAAPLRDLFRPLDATLPFLSPAEQRAIAQFRLTRPARVSGVPPPMGAGMMMAAAMPAVPPNPQAGARVPMTGSHAEFMASLPSELSKASAFEFALRESPLAARLRAAHADLTESEFRALFTAMADAERNRVPPSLDLAAGQVPRSKVLKVVSQGDPAWLGLQAAAARISLPEQQVLAVYEVVRQTNVSLASLANPSGAAMSDRAARIGTIMQERQRRIEQLVGPEQAAMLLNALNEAYRSFALRASQIGAPNTSTP